MPFSEQETARTQARYQRIAPLYDAMEVFAERRYADWRPQLWSMIKGPKVLEVGVGTGKNMPYYPAGVEITAVDLTPGMLERARARAAALEANVNLQLGDVQNLDFPTTLSMRRWLPLCFARYPIPFWGWMRLPEC